MSQDLFVEKSLASLLDRPFRLKPFITAEAAFETFNENTLQVNANLRESGLIDTQADERERALGVCLSLHKKGADFQNVLNWFEKLVTGTYTQYIKDAKAVGSKEGFEKWFSNLDQMKKEIFISAINFIKSLKEVLDQYKTPQKALLDQRLDVNLCDATGKVADLLGWDLK